jgi:U3 small nucleolar RNA-associated protein 18
LDKNLRLYHIDGKDNLKLQSFHIGDMPIITANFTPDGSQVIMTGRRSHFYSLELETGNTLRVTGIRG